ncbi:MAG: T9SS type A sorting domain-containing protein [Perlabentimonas sp.]
MVTGIEETKGINLSVTAYPNPTNDYLTLSITESELSNLLYQLYDMDGKLLQSKKISGNQTKIAMSSLAPATYIIKVIQEKREIKSFKVIKP